MCKATEIEVVPTDEEAKAARKAEKRAAKEAAVAEVEATETAALDAEKAARRAARKAAKEAIAGSEEVIEEDVDEETAALAKAERKAAKKEAKRKAALEAEDISEPMDEEPVASSGAKRKDRDEAPSDSTTASASDKKRKDADGSGIATKEVGAKAFRDMHQIVVESSCPAPVETFDAARPILGPTLTQALLAQGYAAPTPIQAQGWPVALSGRDVVAVAKTGSGKTVGFLLPALLRIAERGPQPARSGWVGPQPARPSILVLAPTRELVQQIAAEAEKFAHVVKARVVTLFGGVPKGDQVREAKRGADIVIATPGRLLDLAAGAPEWGLPPAITLEDVSYLVLDEADRMLDMGFEPDIRKITESCKPSGKPEEGGGAPGPQGGSKRQTLFFTATWPKTVQRTAASLTSNDAVQVRIGQGAGGDKLTANKMVTQTVLMLQSHEKNAKLHEILKDNLGPGETAIVFGGQKRTCDDLTWEIDRNNSYGFKPWCNAMHSGREQWERDETLAKFRTLTAGNGDERGILVATDVAARGLDIPGVALVIVYDFGKSKDSDGASVESYVHRIGRTGRAGKTGRAWAFFTSEDSGACELVELLEGAGQVYPPELKALGDAEWYKNMEKWNKKNRYRKGRGGGKSFGGRGSF